MKAAVLLITALALPLTAAAADHSFDRTLNVPSSPNVAVKTGSGYIHLNPGSDTQIHVTAHMHASSGFFDSASDLENRMQQIASNPPIQQNGDTVIIGETHNDSLYRDISIDYDLTLPRNSAISAATGSGNVEVHNVGASLHAATGSGGLSASGMHGEASLEAGSGSIQLDGSGLTHVTARAGNGDLRLSGITGALQASTGSGNMQIAGSPGADWRLSTGSGSIQMDLGSSTRFTLDASTGSGTVHVAQPMTVQGSFNRHRIFGTVNGGGPTIRVSTGSGDVSIR